MSGTFSSGHARPRELGAEQLTCRRLHVEEAITGAGAGGGGGGAGSFTTLTVSGASSLGGGASVTGNLAATGTVSAATVNATNVGVTNRVTAAILDADPGQVLAATLIVSSTINGASPTIVSNGTGGGPLPIAAGNVFPTLTLPANTFTKYFVVNASSFSGQASNGTDPGTARGSGADSVAAKITAFSNPDNLRDAWIFNASPYSFALQSGALGTNAVNTSRDVWLPYTWLHLSSHSSGGSPAVELTPLIHNSLWKNASPTIPTSPDATINDFSIRYSLLGTPKSGSGILLSGDVFLGFTKAALVDPVRIQVSLPVGPHASDYTTDLALPDAGFIRDWVAQPQLHPGGTNLAVVGVGSMGANASFVLSDATARVVAYVEPGDPAAGYMRIVVSGFTGGAGAYRAHCQFAIPLNNIQYRATYTTF